MIEDSPTRAQDGWSSLSPYPWRRWAARLADQVILGGLLWFSVPLILYTLAPQVWLAMEAYIYEPWFPYVESMISIAALIPINAILIGAARVTPGKLIFGVRVSGVDGRPIGFPAALVREIKVWIFGYAIGIPLVALFAMWASKSELEDRRATRWDREGGHRVFYRPEGGLQTALMLLGAVVIIGGIVGFRILASMGEAPAY